MLMLLLAGVITHNLLPYTIAAGAAFSVGFGAARDLLGWRWGAMVAAALGMTIATLIGSLAGATPAVFMPLTATAAGACAVLALFDEDRWWITLQFVIALLVSGNFPGSISTALDRSLLVLLGGSAQVAVVILLAFFFPRAGARLPLGPRHGKASRRLLISHIVRAGVCVSVALLVARALGLTNSYWAPMTAILILKPGLSDTQSRGVARLAGTFLGCLAATLFALLTENNPYLVVLGIAVTSGLAYALQKAHYGALTCAITATVVLLLSMGNGAVLANAEHRLVATALGGLIALGVSSIFPHRAHSPAPDAVGGMSE